MRTTLAVMALFSALLVYGAIGVFQMVTLTNPTSVIAPKPEKTMGGKLAMVLPDSLTQRQHRILNMAYAQAKSDNVRPPELLQGILMKESHAGELTKYKVAGQEFGLKPNERYYGVAQIKLSATRDVLKNFPELKGKYEFHTETDEEVIAKLIENDAFNIEVASKYIKLLERAGYTDIAGLATAYNQGPSGAKMVEDKRNFGYTAGVMKHIQTLRVSTPADAKSKAPAKAPVSVPKKDGRV